MKCKLVGQEQCWKLVAIRESIGEYSEIVITILMIAGAQDPGFDGRATCR